MSAWLAMLAMAMQAPAELSGLYRTHQIEVGAALELKADGTFLYSLDYGAVSEAAEGHWTARDGTVRLTSDPLAMDLMRDIERSDAAFQDEPLAVEGSELILQRWDTIFAFSKEDQ